MSDIAHSIGLTWKWCIKRTVSDRSTGLLEILLPHLSLSTVIYELAEQFFGDALEDHGVWHDKIRGTHEFFGRTVHFAKILGLLENTTDVELQIAGFQKEGKPSGNILTFSKADFHKKAFRGQAARTFKHVQVCLRFGQGYTGCKVVFTGLQLRGHVMTGAGGARLRRVVW